MTIFPFELPGKVAVSFANHALRTSARGGRRQKNEDSRGESSFNRYRKIGASELAQVALDAVLRSSDLDLPALHLETILRAEGHADLAALAPIEVDFDDRSFFFCSLALGHPDHFRSGSFYAQEAMPASIKKPRSKLERIYTRLLSVASLFECYSIVFSG
jgi:hypothetical protein